MKNHSSKYSYNLIVDAMQEIRGNATQLAESIYSMNDDNPMDPIVSVRGYGRLRLSQLEDKVVKMLDELAEKSRRGNWENVERNLNKQLVQSFIETITDTYKELETIRRRGGKKSRGIKKR